MLASYSITHIPYNDNALAASGTIHSKSHPLHCIADSDFICMVSTILSFNCTVITISKCAHDNTIVKIFIMIYHNIQSYSLMHCHGINDYYRISGDLANHDENLIYEPVHHCMTIYLFMHAYNTYLGGGAWFLCI